MVSQAGDKFFVTSKKDGILPEGTKLFTLKGVIESGAKATALKSQGDQWIEYTLNEDSTVIPFWHVAGTDFTGELAGGEMAISATPCPLKAGLQMAKVSNIFENVQMFF